MASSRLLPCLVLLALLGSLSFCSPAAPAARARSFGLTGPRLEHTPRPLPPVRAGAEAEKPEEGSIGGALLSLLGGVAFWAVLYWIFFKATDHLTNIVQGSPRLEVLSFAILGFLPLVLVQKGYVQYGVDQTCKALARVMPSPGLRHIVEVARPGLHNLMTGLLLFFSVNLLASAVPQQAKFVLPDKLKALDPNRDGVLTGPEVEELVRNFSLKLFSVLFYLESGLFGMAALQKPKDYQAQGKDVLDKYWRELDYRKPKAVLLFLALNAAIVSTTASGCLRAWGLSPRSILALGGVGGLAFGLAAQNLVGNFMGGILLIVNRQFNVGDIIDTNGVQGKVRRMGWINIEIQSGNDLVMLPNAMVLGQKITHINRLRGATPPEP